MEHWTMDILTKKNNVKNNIYPLSYSADMDDFAMTYDIL